MFQRISRERNEAFDDAFLFPILAVIYTKNLRLCDFCDL